MCIFSLAFGNDVAYTLFSMINAVLYMQGGGIKYAFVACRVLVGVMLMMRGQDAESRLRFLAWYAARIASIAGCRTCCSVLAPVVRYKAVICSGVQTRL